MNEYKPDYVSHPGTSLLDAIQALGMSQTELALRAGLSRGTINRIIKGKAGISYKTAINRYDEHMAKHEREEET